MTKSTITREQLIKKAQEQIEFCRHTKITGEGRAHVNQCAALFEIALAALDSEPDRNPVLAYADSYRDMAKQGVWSVPIWSVITDLERNIAPLYRHAQPAPVVPDESYQQLSELYHAQEKRLFKIAQRIKGPAFDKYSHSPSQAIDVLEVAIFGDDESCRAAMLNAQPQSAPQNIPEIIPDGWIPVSERMPVNDGAYLCWDNRYVTTYAFIFGAWQANQFVAKNITHWMPLPNPPKE